MRIAFVHYPGRIARLEAARAGAAPTEFLFGAVELERAGHDVRHFEIDPREPANRLVVRAIDGSAGRGRLPPHLAASSLRGAFRLRGTLRDADVVVATTTGTAMALATWRAAGLLRRPLVGIVAGLLNAPWKRSRAWTTRRLLVRMHALLYGEGELAPLLERAPGLAGRVHVNPFGVDASFWTPSERTAPEEYVVAIGNDGHRDWGTLVRAAREISVPIRVFTAHPPPTELPANVEWRPAGWHDQVLTDVEVRELYRNAAAVVVPVEDVVQPSGQSVTLQALACARPVVLSRTRGLWSPGELQDGVNVVLVPPGDADVLASAVHEVVADPARAAALGAAGRESVLRGATVAAFAERLLGICELAVDRP